MAAGAPVFAGPSCGACHAGILATQLQSRMARTWRSAGQARHLLHSPIGKVEGADPAIQYELSSGAKALNWLVKLPGRPPLSARVEVALGDGRHGYSLLARVEAIEGVKLPREPLVETRYLLGRQSELLLSPGHSSGKPDSYQSAIGRVLSTGFERRCLGCHGAPPGADGTGGIRCQNCHADAGTHAQSGGAIQNPARLPNARQIAACGECHADGRELADPMPEDLLIANQANAMVRSECYIQSGEGLNCSTCHNPHGDASADRRRTETACLSCHSGTPSRHAAVCPVNAREGCAGCHMPAEEQGSFRMVDHWIRVIGGSGRPPAVPSQTPPKRLFLRMILVKSRPEADELRAEIGRGAAFFDLARQHSQDPSAAEGGYLGQVWVGQMDMKLAAAASALAYGQTSAVLEGRAGYLIFQRLPRDFRWQADSLFQEAAALKAAGKAEQALAANQQALELNPTFLRALLFLGINAGELGDTARAAAVLETAARLYPNDPGAQFNLGIAYGSQGRPQEEIAAYRRALAAEPDLAGAYLNLGAALLGEGQPEAAADTYERGIQVNPLAPGLYSSLAQVYDQQGRTEDAAAMRTIAAKINPRLADAR